MIDRTTTASPSPTSPTDSAAYHARVEHAVTRALAGSGDIDVALGGVLDATLAVYGWEWAAVWMVDSSAGTLRCAESRGHPTLRASDFERQSRTSSFAVGEGLPGRVWAGRKPMWLSDAQAEWLPRYAAAREAGLHAAFAFPVLCGADCVGVLEFFTRDKLAIDDSIVATLESVGGQLGQFIERKRSEHDLMREQARLAALVDSALDAIVGMDHLGRVTDWNPAAESTFGYARAEAMGREMASLIVPPQLRASHREGLARHLAGGDAPVLGKRLELTAVNRKGTEFPVELTITRVKTAGPPLFTGFIRDTTLQRATLRELEHSRALFKSIAETTPDVVSIYDVRANAVVYTNREIASTLGYAPEEVVALGDSALAKLIHPDDFAEVTQIIAGFDSLRDGEVAEYELRALHKDGSYRWLANRTVVFTRLPDGRPQRVLTSAQDVTQRKADEERLREAEERLRLGLDAGAVGTWDWDILNDRVTWSDRVYEFHGMRPGEFGGRVSDFRRLIHPEDQPQVGESLRRAMETDAPYEAEFRVVQPSGTARWLSTTGKVLRDAAGTPVRMLGATSDITSRKAAESERDALLESERAARSEAERASRLKDEFLATVSHELRTPLNAILGYAQLLQRRPLPPEIAEPLEVIARNARAQTEIISDLLDMSRIVSGKLRLDVQRVELPRVIEAALQTVEAAAAAKNIRLVSTLDPRAGPVSGDPGRLQQVVWNLLTNAVKFTPKGGRIQIVLARVNSHVEIAVSDTGSGISAEFLPYVFEKFRQFDASSTRVHGGLGLGLALVKHLAELHGGTVRASSPGEGRGATFVVELPLTAIHAEPADEMRRHPSAAGAGAGVVDGPSLEGITVLAVDDEHDSRELVRRILEERGARVLTAESAAEALELLQRESVDLLLSDIGMPGVDGYELVRRVRALPPERGGDVPAAALTAFARSEDRTRALLAGYQTHVAKPVEPDELAAVAASLAGHRRGPGSRR